MEILLYKKMIFVLSYHILGQKAKPPTVRRGFWKVCSDGCLFFAAQTAFQDTACFKARDRSGLQLRRHLSFGVGKRFGFSGTHLKPTKSCNGNLVALFQADDDVFNYIVDYQLYLRVLQANILRNFCDKLRPCPL